MCKRLARGEFFALFSGTTFLRRVPWLCGISFVLILIPRVAGAQQATLTDDAYTSAKKTNRNFGTDENLLLTASSEKDFVKFKLTPNLPAGTVGSHIGKATLKLFVGSVNAPGA